MTTQADGRMGQEIAGVTSVSGYFHHRIACGALMPTQLRTLWKTQAIYANTPVITDAGWAHGQQAARIGDYEQDTAKKRTRRERFLGEMEKVVPWKALIDLIESHYPKANSKGSRPPYPLVTTLRIHLLQQWYDLSDPAMEDAL